VIQLSEYVLFFVPLGEICSYVLSQVSQVYSSMPRAPISEFFQKLPKFVNDWPGASLDSNVYNTANMDFPVKVSHPFVPDLNCLYMAQGKSPLETCNNIRTWKKKQTKFTFRGKEQRNQCHCLNLQANNYKAIPRKKTTKILHCRFQVFRIS